MHKSLNTSIQSFNNTKSSIVGSALGKALGMSTTNNWATVVDKLKGVSNRGNWNGSISTSGGSVTIPSGYHGGSGKVTGPTLGALIGTNVNLDNNARLLSGYTAYGKNGTKYTGTLVAASTTNFSTQVLHNGATREISKTVTSNLACACGLIIVISYNRLDKAVMTTSVTDRTLISMGGAPVYGAGYAWVFACKNITIGQQITITSAYTGSGMIASVILIKVA